MNKETGGPAFPTTDFTHAGQVIPGSEGMTLRDYFAAKAMQGLFASGHYEGLTNLVFLSSDAYSVADAMLKAREQ